MEYPSRGTKAHPCAGFGICVTRARGIHAHGPLKCMVAPGAHPFAPRKAFMSSNTSQHAASESQDPVERIVPSMPIVLPVVGGVLIFLLAFIAVFMA